MDQRTVPKVVDLLVDDASAGLAGHQAARRDRSGQASYISRVVRLAFLSPAVVDAALQGTLRAGVDAAALTPTDAVPACWTEQRHLVLPTPSVTRR